MQNEALATTPALMLDEPHSRRVYYSSMLSAISALVAFHYELYDFTLLAVIVLVNSINYWRHPIPGWRRNLDMICAAGACWYQMFASFDLHSQLFFMGVGVDNRWKTSTSLHCKFLRAIENLTVHRC